MKLTVFQVPKSSRYRSVPLEAYPESLQEDICRYLERLQGTVLFADDGPPRPLRHMTIVKIKADIRQTLDAAVNAGASLEQFLSLADLVAPSVVRSAFLWTVARRGGDVLGGLKNTMGTLLAIAKHYAKLSAPDIKTLQNMRSQLGDDPIGMSDKNRVRLIQFDEWRNVAALVTLPKKLLDRAKSKAATLHSGTDALYAVAITLLLACPMRMKNLAVLDIGENLLISGSGVNRRFSIWVPGSAVKNGVAIEVPLLAGPSKVLATYLDQFRPSLLNQPSSALFPSRTGTCRGPSALGYGIKTIIFNETGLTVNPHLFRHVTAKLYLERFPGDYESVRQQLGHRKHDTTTTFHAQFDTRRAQERYAEAVLEPYMRGKPR